MALIPYIRRSRKDEEEISIKSQIDAILGWARARDIELLPPIVEKGVSGHKNWRERELGTIIERCASGEAEGIAVAYFSRLTREKLSATFEVLEELEPLRFVSVRDGIDTAPGEPKTDLMTVIRGHQANEEWTTNKKWLTKGKHWTWEAGAYVTAQLPAGYDREPVFDARGREKGASFLRKNEHAETIAQAFAIKAGGGSWAETARALEGVPTRTGNTKWTPPTARALIVNPIYKGVFRCQCGCGDEAFRADLAMVTPSVWGKAQPTKVGPGRKDPGRSLLAGIVRCASCGVTMGGAPITRKGRTYRYYRCRNIHCTGRCGITASHVEAFLKDEALFLWHQTEPTVGRKADVERLAALEHERDALKAEVAAYVRNVSALTPGFADGLTDRQRRLNDAEAALIAEQTARVERLDPEHMRKVFEAGSTDEQRRVIRTFISAAFVSPGREPVEQRVRIQARPVVFN